MPAFTPLLNTLKRASGLSVQGMMKQIPNIAQLAPEQAAEEMAIFFHGIMDKIGPHNAKQLKAVEQFLGEFASVAASDNPALAHQVNQQLGEIKRLNGVKRFEALKKLIIGEQLNRYFAEYWKKFLQSDKPEKWDAITDVLQANFDKTFDDNKMAAQQMVYTPEGLLMSRFIRLLKTVFDMTLVMADLDPVFKPEGATGNSPQFYPMPGK